MSCDKCNHQGFIEDSFMKDNTTFIEITVAHTEKLYKSIQETFTALNDDYHLSPSTSQVVESQLHTADSIFSTIQSSNRVSERQYQALQNIATSLDKTYNRYADSNFN